MPASAHSRSEGSGRDPQLKKLLIRPGAIGDIIVSLPALEHCRNAGLHPTEVWVPSPVVPLIRFADCVRSIASVGLDLLELGYDCPARSLLTDFDSIISWYGASRPQFRSSVAHLPVEFHAALPCGIHATDFYMRQVGGPEGPVPFIDIAEVQRRDFIAVHPFSGSAKKNWPLNNFRELAGSLPLPVEFSAGPEEQLADAHRFDNLYELARWLASARAYVGNDSGVTHLAAAVGTPVVAIFCATDPDIWAPRGRRPVQVLRGMPSVPEVWEAVTQSAMNG